MSRAAVSVDTLKLLRPRTTYSTWWARGAQRLSELRAKRRPERAVDGLQLVRRSPIGRSAHLYAGLV